MACGKPVVASRIEGTTDIFEDSGAIKLVPPEDPGRLAKAILDMLGQPEKITAMGKSGRDYIANHYNRRSFARLVVEKASEKLDAKV